MLTFRELEEHLKNGSPGPIIPRSTTKLSLYCSSEKEVFNLLQCLKNQGGCESVEHLRLGIIGARSIETLLNLRLKLKTVQLKVGSDVPPLMLLNYLLSQTETLENLWIELPTTFTDKMVLTMHSVYPVSFHLKTYTLIMEPLAPEPRLLACCSHVSNCKWVRYEKGKNLKYCTSCLATPHNVLLLGNPTLLNERMVKR